MKSIVVYLTWWSTVWRHCYWKLLGWRAYCDQGQTRFLYNGFISQKEGCKKMYYLYPLLWNYPIVSNIIRYYPLLSLIPYCPLLSSIIYNDYPRLSIFILCLKTISCMQIQKLSGFNAYYGCYYCHIRGCYSKSKRHIYYPTATTFRRRRLELTIRDMANIERYAAQVLKQITKLLNTH